MPPASSSSDPTPAGLTFVGNTGDCTTAFPCALGTIPAGQTRTIVATFLVPAGYAAPSILNTASATTTVTDGDVANNSASVSTAVIQPSADLSLTKTGPASVTPDELLLALVVTNTGPNEATAVTVADVTPPGLTFVSTTGACTTPFPCALGTLASGQSAAITATFAVPAGYTTPNPIVNTASVSSQTSDPNSTNNAATTATTGCRHRRADLAITKSRPLRSSLGANLGYTSS